MNHPSVGKLDQVYEEEQIYDTMRSDSVYKIQIASL